MTVLDALQWSTIGLVAVSAILLVAAHRRGRATVFTDVTLRASTLVLAVVYLGYLSDHADTFRADPLIFKATVATLLLLIAAFLLSLSASLWRLSARTEGIVLVTPSFLVGLRSRMTTMYGPTSASYVAYAVGKESARKATRSLLEGRFATPRTAWRRLPHWFRMMGYGKLDYLERAPGDHVRVKVRGTFEATYSGPDAGTCDLTRGYLAGIGESLEPGRACEVTEDRCCRLDGGETCEFTMRWFEPIPPVDIIASQPRAAEVR